MLCSLFGVENKAVATKEAERMKKMKSCALHKKFTILIKCVVFVSKRVIYIYRYLLGVLDLKSTNFCQVIVKGMSLLHAKNQLGLKTLVGIRKSGLRPGSPRFLLRSVQHGVSLNGQFVAIIFERRYEIGSLGNCLFENPSTFLIYFSKG